MKSLPSGLAAHIAQGTATLAWLLRVTRTDAQVFAFTSASTDLVVGGVRHLSAPGLDISNIVLSAGLAVDNLELTTLDDGSTFTRADVMGGKWRNAAFVIERCNYRSISDGVESIMTGHTGNVELRNGYIVAELRGLQQILQQDIGAVSSKTCRARLGDDLCTVNLAGYTHTASVTSVTSNQLFTASGLAQADDYFGEGILTWTSGANSGLSVKVKTHATGGVLTLMLPAFLTVEVGHNFSIVAGCRKRLEDCRDKFANAINMQAEPHLPGIDTLTASPT